VYGVNYRMITDGSASGFTGSAGFNGIVAALFGQLHPILTVPASVLFGALLVGANSMQRVVQVPSAFVIALNGLVVVFVVSSEILRRRRQRRRLTSTHQDEETSPPANADKEKIPQAETAA
jgi:simple sugar transport system permease protein